MARLIFCELSIKFSSLYLMTSFQIEVRRDSDLWLSIWVIFDGVFVMVALLSFMGTVL